MKIINLILCLLTFSAIVSGQQPWIPDGAEWHYGFDRANPALNYGYIKISQIGDTILLGKNCKILDQWEVNYHWYPSPGISEGSKGHVYTYSDNDKVYTYKNGKFYTLYDFSAEPGDSWTVCWYGDIFEDTGRVIVNSTGLAFINGETLRTFNVSRTQGSCVGWHDATIVERIGCISYEYLFPDYDSECIPDVQINGYFRCYKDDNFPLYSVSGSDTICEYIWTGTNEKESDDNRILITPNPADMFINVNIKSGNCKNILLSLFSSDGRCVIPKKAFHTSTVVLDVSTLSPGLYIINVTFHDGTVVNKRVIIE